MFKTPGPKLQWGGDSKRKRGDDVGRRWHLAPHVSSSHLFSVSFEHSVGASFMLAFKGIGNTIKNTTSMRLYQLHFPHHCNYYTSHIYQSFSKPPTLSFGSHLSSGTPVAPTILRCGSLKQKEPWDDDGCVRIPTLQGTHPHIPPNG